MPSTTSSVVSRPLASSTVITPSLPTFSIASLMIFPMVASPLAEMVPTWAISFGSLVALESFFSSATTASTALSIPSLISLATVTPSFVMVGEPNDFSITTLRPLGPRVTFTASASVLTPLRMASRARTSNRISLAAISVSLRWSVGLEALLLDDAEDVFLAHHEVLLPVDLDLGSGVLREEHAVTRLDVQRADLAVLEDLAVSDSDHFALDGLFLCGVGDDDAALGLLFLLHALHDHAILQRPNLHGVFPPEMSWHSRKESAKARAM